MNRITTLILNLISISNHHFLEIHYNCALWVTVFFKGYFFLYKIIRSFESVIYTSLNFPWSVGPRCPKKEVSIQKLRRIKNQTKLALQKGKNKETIRDVYRLLFL